MGSGQVFVVSMTMPSGQQRNNNNNDEADADTSDKENEVRDKSAIWWTFHK